MNRENLQRMADYIRTVPQRSFTMDSYRTKKDVSSPKCNSVGCVIGHCTILAPDLFNDILQEIEENIYVFSKWSFAFTGLSPFEDEWDWCFDSLWRYVDNTPTGAADRIEWLLNNGLPENWRNKMYGNVPREQLCYKK